MSELLPPQAARREFLRFLAASPILGALGTVGCRSAASFAEAENLFDLERAATLAMGPDSFAYLAGGADDERTVRANLKAFRELQIRARRLVDVRTVDTTCRLFGQPLTVPILLAPVGFQTMFHPEGELASARGATAAGHAMIVSSASNHAIGAVGKAAERPVWFQLYPTPDRAITRELLRRAEAAKCPVVALTIDTPIIGNREGHGEILRKLIAGGAARMPNYEGLLDGQSITDAGMTWDMLAWLKSNCSMRVVLKGIVTHEDAALAVQHGADGVIVSNHGGRQEESERGTLECLPEVVETIDGQMPVLIDGGFRRGTDVFKALALGADAVCIGRPYIWGLAAGGANGVEHALTLLHAELVRIMQLAGAPSLAKIDQSHVEAS